MNATRRNDLIVFLATGCFTGFLPLLPGTWGTFASIPVVIIAHKGGTTSQLIVAVCFVVLAVWIAGKAEVLLGTRDAGPIVIDEMAGFMICFLWLPLSLLTVCVGFVLFRLFDIVKPPPIDSLEKRLHSGWGVVMDDVFAGFYTNIRLRIFLTLAGLV
jgi:phosphatidylglycerophosphatase A